MAREGTPQEFRREARDRRVATGPPNPVRSGGPGDPNGGYYATTPQAPVEREREWNGPPRPERV